MPPSALGDDARQAALRDAAWPWLGLRGALSVPTADGSRPPRQVGLPPPDPSPW